MSVRIYLRDLYGDGWALHEGSLESLSRELKRRNIIIAPTASIGSDAIIGAGASIGAGARIGDRAHVGDWAIVGDRAHVGDRAVIGGSAYVGYQAKIGYRVNIGYQANIGAGANIRDGAIVGAEVSLGYRARIGEGASILRTSDCLTIGPLGREDRTLTGYRHANTIWCETGCFSGTIQEFELAVDETHGDGKHGIAYRHAIAYLRAALAVDGGAL